METSYQPVRLRQFLQKFGSLRILRFLVALLLITKLLTACLPQPVTLRFAVLQAEAEHWRPLIAQFQAETQHKIKIKLFNLEQREEEQPKNSNEVKKIYTKAFTNKTPYDLIYMDVIWVPEFAHNDLLRPLSDDFRDHFSIDKLKEQGFLRHEIDSGIYNKKVYRIPFRTDIGVLYYRKDLLDKDSQRPQTFSALNNVAQQLQKKNSPNVKWGYLWQYGKYEGLVANFVEILHGYGGFWIKENNDVGLKNPEAINAVKFLRATIQEEISPKDVLSQPSKTLHEEDHEKLTSKLFGQGKAVFMRNWPDAWSYVNGPDSNIRGKVGIIPMSHAENQKQGGACQGGWGFGIAKGTQHPNEAVKAVEFFTSAAAQRQFTLSFGSVPSLRKLLLDPQIVAKYSHYPELLNWMDGNKEPVHWISRPRISKYAAASCILQKHLSEALNPNPNGYPSPEDAMNDATKETQELLQKGKEISECAISNQNN